MSVDAPGERSFGFGLLVDAFIAFVVTSGSIYLGWQLIWVLLLSRIDQVREIFEPSSDAPAKAEKKRLPSAVDAAKKRKLERERTRRESLEAPEPDTMPNGPAPISQ
ncbi:hypothetical protein DIPPA_27049 [Diplonema papillatum]|nr:hypothetical protein DIPPA_27049 [Diplonema papillatum]